jgi:Mg2+/Co2+ transporter CorB
VETAITAILIFAGASFFFALAETALFSLGKWQARQLAERRPLAGKIVARLLEHPQDLLATLALGNTFANAAMLAVALRMVFNAHWTLALTMIALAGAGAASVARFFQKRWRCGSRNAGRCASAWPLPFFRKFPLPLYRAAQWLNAALLKKAARKPPRQRR